MKNHPKCACVNFGSVAIQASQATNSKTLKRKHGLIATCIYCKRMQVFDHTFTSMPSQNCFITPAVDERHQDARLRLIDQRVMTL